LILKGDVDVGAVKEIQELLYAGIEGADVTTVHTSELRGLLQRRPRSAISDCERRKSFATCIATLAVKLDVSEVVLGRASATEQEGMKFLFLAIRPNRAVEPRAALELSAGEPVSDKVTRQWIASVLDTQIPGDPGGGEISSPEGEAVAAQPISPSPAVRSSVLDPPSAVDGSSSAEAVAPACSASISAAPGPAPIPSDSDLKSTSAGTSAAAAALVGLRPSAEQDGTSEVPAWRATLRWGGLAVALGGVGALGAAGYFSSEMHSANSQLRERDGLTQRDAQALADRAASHANNANILLAVGAGALITGLSTFFSELLLE
jgi:hypothetical protein